MAEKKGKWFHFITKLNELSQKDALAWERQEAPEDLNCQGYVVDVAFVTCYEGKWLRIFERKLRASQDLCKEIVVEVNASARVPKRFVV